MMECERPRKMYLREDWSRRVDWERKYASVKRRNMWLLFRQACFVYNCILKRCLQQNWFALVTVWNIKGCK
jgi:hypothetical protein